ncbi:MAG: hypothetical protein M0036_11295 [Desulfobacteraceae bacterium]|nr:hypothetical protein [Desulfobacteraceae bacterium]
MQVLKQAAQTGAGFQAIGLGSFDQGEKGGRCAIGMARKHWLWSADCEGLRHRKLQICRDTMHHASGHIIFDHGFPAHLGLQRPALLRVWLIRDPLEEIGRIHLSIGFYSLIDPEEIDS